MKVPIRLTWTMIVIIILIICVCRPVHRTTITPDCVKYYWFGKNLNDGNIISLILIWGTVFLIGWNPLSEVQHIFAWMTNHNGVFKRTAIRVLKVFLCMQNTVVLYMGRYFLGIDLLPILHPALLTFHSVPIATHALTGLPLMTLSSRHKQKANKKRRMIDQNIQCGQSFLDRSTTQDVEIHRLEQKITKLEGDLHRTSTSLGQCRAENFSMRANVAKSTSFQRERDSLFLKINSTCKNERIYREKAASLTNELKKKNSQLVSKNKQIEKCAQQINELKTQNDLRSNQLRDVQSEIEYLSARLRMEATKFQRLEKQVAVERNYLTVSNNALIAELGNISYQNRFLWDNANLFQNQSSDPRLNTKASEPYGQSNEYVKLRNENRELTMLLVKLSELHDDMVQAIQRIPIPRVFEKYMMSMENFHRDVIRRITKYIGPNPAYDFKLQMCRTLSMADLRFSSSPKSIFNDRQSLNSLDYEISSANMWNNGSTQGALPPAPPQPPRTLTAIFSSESSPFGVSSFELDIDLLRTISPEHRSNLFNQIQATNGKESNASLRPYLIIADSLNISRQKNLEERVCTSKGKSARVFSNH